jgi:hypothetical protein
MSRELNARNFGGARGCCSDVSKGLEAGDHQGKDVHCVAATNEVSTHTRLARAFVFLAL